jgi:hypothetical protein
MSSPITSWSVPENEDNCNTYVEDFLHSKGITPENVGTLTNEQVEELENFLESKGFPKNSQDHLSCMAVVNNEVIEYRTKTFKSDQPYSTPWNIGLNLAISTYAKDKPDVSQDQSTTPTNQQPQQRRRSKKNRRR